MFSATPTPIIPTLTPTPYPYFEPAGCKLPGEDYALVEINGWTINQRTLEMLRYASELFNGDAEYLPALITQGSYHDNGAASWGTHLGGGAVDLSVMLPGTYTIDGNHISLMIRALRTAGFAAWFRDANELFPESAVHIHAIAIGDAQLSDPALQQLISEEGYFFGNNGIPVDNGIPIPDRHGGALTCTWMIDMGYPAPYQTDEMASPWQMRLQKAASQAVTETEQQTIAFAEMLGFYPGTVRGLEDLDAPLAIWMLHESGLVTAPDAMLFQFPNFRLGSLDSEWRFWAQFPAYLFTRFDYSVSPGSFDFTEWPLMAGDVVLTQSNGMYTHVFMVTQTDAAGSVFSVAPFRQSNGEVVLKNLLVFHPDQSVQGLLENEWSGCLSAECSEPGGLLCFDGRTFISPRVQQ